MTNHRFRLPVRFTVRFSVRLAASAVVAATVLAACGGGSSSSTSPSDVSDAPPPATAASLPTADPVSTPPPEPPTTARWDALLDTIGEDGEVTKQLAIDAFSLGVAPLPGSSVRRTDSDEMVADASSAIAWITRHFDELSPDQQAAVGAALSPPDSLEPVGASGFRNTSSARTAGEPGAQQAARTIGCYGQVVPTADSPGAEQYRVIVDQVTADIENRLGGAIELVAPIYVVVDHRDLGVALAYTWADPGDCNQNGLATCTIHLSADAEKSDPTDQLGILAHEVMHCFQFQYLGMGANDLPAWILEGLPAWVGEDIAGGTKVSTKWWTKYLTTPERSLYGREYDAIGFYAHLDEVGIDPWSHVVSIFDGFSNEPAFEGAGASSGSFLESWPSSVLRRTTYGRAWDATGPGITIDRATPVPLSVANGTVATGEAGKVSGRLYDVTISADLVTVEFDGWARLAADDGTDVVLSSGSTFCARAGGCVCPDGTSAPFDQIAANVVVGLTGGTSPASIAISGAELDCDEPEVEAIVDPCLVGQWISTTSYIDDTVTGAPVDELGGGDGIVLVISKDGSFVMDFDGSSPTSTDLGHGLVISTKTRGVAHGHITATNGQVQLIDQDYKTALTTEMSTGGLLPGGTGIGSGTYSCAPGSMEMRTPFELGETINAFRSA